MPEPIDRSLRVARLSSSLVVPGMAAPTPHPTVVSSTASSRPGRMDDLLLIGVDAQTRESLSRAVMATDCTLSAWASVDDGLRGLRQQRCRLLLLDLDAPAGEGMRFLHALRAEPALRPGVLIVLAASEQYHLVPYALEAGADDYLMKPLTAHDAGLRIGMWLRRVPSVVLPTPSGLTIRSLGRFTVERDGQERLTERGRARKAGLLFKYLLTHRGRTVTTAEVLALLWPESGEQLAATDLRSLLYQLRQQLGFRAGARSCLEHTSATVALHLSAEDWWDVAEFTAYLREAAACQHVDDGEGALRAYTAAMDLYQGDYLAEDLYADWARSFRQHLRDAWLRALAATATLRGERGERDEQEALLRVVVDADPYREPIYRALMALLAEQGRGAEALVLYRQLCALLTREFEAQPAPETRTLALRIGGRSS